MLNYNTIQGIWEYRSHPSVSQSQLKQLVMPTQYREESEIMNKGSYLDHILTMEEPVEDYFTIADVDRPSDAIVLYCNTLYNACRLDLYIDADLEKYRGYLEGVDLLDSYYKSSTREKTVGIFIRNASDWWRFMVESNGKIRLTKEEVETLDDIKSRVMSSPLSMYFTNGKMEISYQKDFYWTFGGLNCKGLADIVVEGKDLMEIDIKYTEAGSMESWWYIMRKLHYPFQKAFYKDGLEKSTGKQVRSYWMVLGKYFQHLVEVPDFLMDWGRAGYDIEHGKVGGIKSTRHVPGYMDAANLYGKEKAKLPLFIRGEDLKNLMFKNEE